MMKQIKLGLLEFGELYKNQYDYPGLLKYVQCADELGFQRIWFAEHYHDNVAFSNPEALLPMLASSTKKISVGTGGVLLKYHSAYRIATFYKLLATLFPGRIDLGLCKTLLPAKLGAQLLGAHYEEEPSFPEKVLELLNLLDALNLEAPSGLTIPPPIAETSKPSLWMLNSSFEDIHQYPPGKINYCRSLFHTTTTLRTTEKELIKTPDKACKKAIAIAVYCSENKSKNNAFLKSLQEKSQLQPEKIMSCTPKELHERILELTSGTAIKEIVILNLGKNYREKTKVLHLLKKQFS